MKKLMKFTIIVAIVAMSGSNLYAQSSTGNTVDLSKQPDLVNAIVNNPANWPILLKAHNKTAAASSDAIRKKQVIRDIIAYLIREHLVKDRAEIASFLLTDTEFLLNGKLVADKRQQFLKDEYIPAPGYKIYYGNAPMSGNGIFQRKDNL